MPAGQRTPRFREKLKKVILSVEVPDLKKRLVDGVVKPGLKNLAFDMWNNIANGFTDTVGILIFQDDYKKRRKRINGGNGLLTYWNGSNNNNNRFPSATTGTITTISTQTTQRKQVVGGNWNFDCVGWDTEFEARAALEDLKDLIHVHNRARVRDFFDIADQSWDYTSENWGWVDNMLDDPSVRPVNVGGEKPWILQLPQPVPLPSR